MLRRIIKTLKKIPIDFGQFEVRYTTKGKLIAYALVGEGAGKKALDVGCRDGYWSKKLMAKGYDVTSIDIEPQYPGALQVDADQRLPFADDSFDLIWCAEVIEHLKDPGFTISEFKRILKPSGQLLLTTPNESFWFFRMFEAMGIALARIQNEDHTFCFTYDGLRQVVGGGQQFGYFPYLLYKRTVMGPARRLSPTIVHAYRNEKT